MAILIDGYNLMYAIGWVPTSDDSDQWRRCRRRLLDFLASRLDTHERNATTIVFDAQNAPPGLPHELQHRGIRILFAANHPEADDLIEELIAANHVPKQLTVVSSDHRIERAARRRRAHTSDCEPWFMALESRPAEADFLAGHAAGETGQEPQPDESPADIQSWVALFGDVGDIPLASSPRSQSQDIEEMDTGQRDQTIEHPFDETYLKRITEEFPDA